MVKSFFFFQMDMYKGLFKLKNKQLFSPWSRAIANLVVNLYAKKDQKPKKRLYLKSGHPSFTRSIYITKIRPDGNRGIVAAEDINIGDRIVDTEPFATVVALPCEPYCFTCHKLGLDMEPCKVCNLIYFCSKKCKISNRTHPYECGTNFHAIENLDVKCAIQMVLKTMSIFDTWHELKNFTETAKNREFPQESYDQRSKLDAILKDTRNRNQINGDVQKMIDAAFELISTLPVVLRYFNIMNDSDNKEQNNLLKQLITHFIRVIMVNAFETPLQFGQKKYSRRSIYDVFSFVNHSCVPNMVNFVDGNKMIGFACQNITSGQQLTTCYIMASFKKNTISRRDLLQTSFGIRCQCERCKCNTRTTQDMFDIALRMRLDNIQLQLASDMPLVEKVPLLWAYHEKIRQYCYSH